MRFSIVTHFIVRGRRANGHDLILPPDFIRHGLRNIARDVATEWLGERTPEQERLALDREIRRHGPTRLDRLLEPQIGTDGVVKSSKVEAPNGDAQLTQALKARLRELQRMGLAMDAGPGLVRLASDWRHRLDRLELHLDIRKRVMRERADQSRLHRQVAHDLRKGLLGR